MHPRSGLAARHGLSIVNTPGTVDAGYRGEIKVLLINHDLQDSIELRRGDRVAQLVIQRYEQAHFSEVAELPDSSRGEGGYGSTGGFGSRQTRPARHPRPGECFVKFRRKKDEDSSSDETETSTEETESPGGPYDADDVADDGVERVDLGSLLIEPEQGRELRLQVDEASGNVQSVVLAGSGRRDRAAGVRRPAQR